MEKEQRDWHRLFGLFLMDFFSNSPFRVELEKDLSLRRQLLDVVVVRREEGVFHERLPDGLDPLALHNLITFKSYWEALDDWVLKELTGHYVNYRKQVSPATGELLLEKMFRLFAVCARPPQKLAGQVALVPVQPCVYDCRRGTDMIRVVVLAELPQSEHNAPLHLFSASREQVRYGAEHYRQRSAETSSLLGRLWEQYRKEGVPVPYTMEDFRRDYTREHLKDLTPEERLEGLPPEERLKGLPPEERLKGLSLEEQLAALSPEAKEVLRKQLQGPDKPENPA
jgi:hypothetical protein